MSRGRRATVVGGGLSALFHLSLLALLAAQPRPVSLGESGPSTVTIELQATSVEAPPEQPPATAISAAPVERRARQALRPVSRRLPAVPVAVAHDSEVRTSVAPENGAAQDGGDDPDEGAATGPAPAPALIAEAATPVTPTKAPVIAPETARALRVYDTFPLMLAQNSVSRAEVMVEVCVSDHGQVSDAIIAQSSLRRMDNTLRAAIRSWRYRPLVVNGAPTPFCHFMRIKYAMN